MCAALKNKQGSLVCRDTLSLTHVEALSLCTVIPSAEQMSIHYIHEISTFMSFTCSLLHGTYVCVCMHMQNMKLQHAYMDIHKCTGTHRGRGTHTHTHTQKRHTQAKETHTGIQTHT
jgi:hypothetical protein